MARILIFSGGGDYADPWHPFAETSARVARALEADRHDIRIVDTVAGLDAALGAADLLIVNAGGGLEPQPLDDQLLAVLAAHGGPMLALHVAATLLPEHEEWERMLGGRWVRGTTFHPARGPFTVRAASQHPVVSGWGERTTDDEAYAWLRVAADSEVLLVHDLEDSSHALCWLATIDGRRVAYDALGHDAAAYDSPHAGQLIRRLVSWLLGNGPSAPMSPRGESLDSAL